MPVALLTFLQGLPGQHLWAYLNSHVENGIHRTIPLAQGFEEIIKIIRVHYPTHPHLGGTLLGLIGLPAGPDLLENVKEALSLEFGHRLPIGLAKHRSRFAPVV